MREKLNGNKTYLVALLTVVWAVVGASLGHLEWSEVPGLLAAAGVLVGLRSAYSKGK